MPSKKKSTAVVGVDPQAAALSLTQEKAEAPAMGRVVTVEQRIYSKPMTPDEQPAEFEATPDDDLEAFDENGADSFSEDLLNFFDADGGDGGYKLRVLQITNAKNGAKFMRGGSIYRGEIPYTPEYLRDVQENFGGGLFRLQVVGSREDPNTGRMKFGIIKCKTVTIAAPPNLRINLDPQAGPQQPGIYGAPQIPYMNGPMIPEDRPSAKDNLAEIVAIIGMVDKLRGGVMAPQMNAPPPLDPDLAALSIIAKSPGVMERLGEGLGNKIFGPAPAEGNEWAEAFKELIRSGQGPEMLRVVVQEIVRPFSDAFNARGAPPAPGPAPAPGAGAQPPAIPGNNQAPQQPQQPAPAQDPAQAQAQGEQRQPLPEEQALWLLMDFCARRIGPDIAADRLLKYADMLNEQAPQYSIDNYLAAFIEMTPDQALEFVKSQPNGEGVTKLEHARQWTADVQALIKRAFTNEG